MRVLIHIVRKEFLQIFRNSFLLPLIVLMPIIQLIILAHAADYEIKGINLHIIDQDQSAYSRLLLSKFLASEHFDGVNSSYRFDEGMDDIESDKADLILHLPPNFEKDLRMSGTSACYIAINAINGVKAGLASGYAQSIIRQFNLDLNTQQDGSGMSIDKKAGIAISYRNWYNPDLDYDSFMVPGILVLLVTLIGMFLSGINIVREKEVGTIEQINVTPIRKQHFILGKLIPFWIIAMVDLVIGLIVGKLIFQIPMVGSLGIVFVFATLYLIVVLGLGLFISTITETQQQAMFIAWFCLIIFILMSGLFTPIESMPGWAQWITKFNPVAYFVDVMRLVLLKGSSLVEIRPHILYMVLFAIVINSLAVWNYRKTA